MELNENVLVIAAGLKGGTAKSTTMSLLESWYRHCAGVKPKCFDFDPGGTFRSLTEAYSPYYDSEGQPLSEAAFDIKSVANSIMEEVDPSVYLVDMPSSSLEKIEPSFAAVDWASLQDIYGLSIVILAVATADTESVAMIDKWKSLVGSAEVIYVANPMSGQVDEDVLSKLDPRFLNGNELPIPFPLYTDTAGNDSKMNGISKEVVDLVKKNKWNWSYLSIVGSDRYFPIFVKREGIEDDKQAKRAYRKHSLEKTKIIQDHFSYFIKSGANVKDYWGLIQMILQGKRMDSFYDGLDAKASLLLPDGASLYTLKKKPVFHKSIFDYVDKFSLVKSIVDFNPEDTDLSEASIAQSASFSA